MRKSTVRPLLLCGSALMGLSLLMTTAHAADQSSPLPVANPVQSLPAGPTDQGHQDLPVVTNHDQAAKPSQTTDWANPADYRHAVPVQILGINDFHGGLEQGGKALIDGKVYQGTGTVARLSAYLNAAENDFKVANPNGTTFRVEAGDMVGASPANSALLQDESTMHALKAMNIAIGTLGNHEFDEGLPEFLRIVKGAAPTKQYNEATMNYPHVDSGISIITANVIEKKTGQVPDGLQPYLVKEIHTSDGKVVKVGFIGIETTDLPILTLYDNYKDYEILDEAETIAKYSKILRGMGVNAIVVLAHTAVESEHGETKGDSVNILQKLHRIDPNNSVDVYLAAHSHQYANATVGQTRLVQAIYTGKAYNDIIGYIDPTTNDFIGDSLVAHVYPVLSEKDDPQTVADPTVLAIVKDANDRVNPIVNKRIGMAATAETIRGRLSNSKTMENGAGEVVVDGQLYAAKKAGLPADFAMTNTGGVRADIVVGPDKSITWGAAQAVQPFGNILRVVRMTGAQVRAALEQQYDEDQKYYLQIAGLKYIYTDQDDQNQPYRVVAMTKDDGTPLKDDENYHVVINDFLAGGGDSFTAFKDLPLVGIVGQDTESFIEYITDMTTQGTPIATPKLDRKVYRTGAELAALAAAANATGQSTPDPAGLTPDPLPTNAPAAMTIGALENSVGTLTPRPVALKTAHDRSGHQPAGHPATAMTLPRTGDQATSNWLVIGLALLGLLGFAGGRTQRVRSH